MSEPTPAETQKSEKRDFQVIMQELELLNAQEENAALQMGDVFVEIEDTYGKAKVWEAADQLKITRTKAKQRLWVSRKFPQGHQVRDTHLTFSHLREIAGTEDPEAWVEKTLAEDYSVAQLSDAIAQAGDGQAQAAGEPCAWEKCGQQLPKDGEIVSFRIGKGHAKRVCSVACAQGFFSDAVQSQLVSEVAPDPYEAVTA